MLLDEDGSFYQNGSKDAKENKIYLIVKRDEDNSIREVKQITIEEVMVMLAIPPISQMKYYKKTIELYTKSDIIKCTKSDNKLQ